jgi:hypothetical protein
MGGEGERWGRVKVLKVGKTLLTDEEKPAYKRGKRAIGPPPAQNNFLEGPF